MTLVVPAVLGGLALAVMALVSIINSRRARTLPSRRGAAAQVRVLVHSINDDRCTGCDACVAVCPTNVLDLVDNKSRVLRFQDCIQCEACMWACPTTALVMHPEGTEPPKLFMPELDQSYQTAVPGQYLIGEVAGKPLVKNAANLGRGVVEHMLAGGLQPLGSRGSANTYDVAIVGSGPGGLSAALTCMHRGLSYVLLEKDTLVASTVARYPKGKLIMAEPYDVDNLSFLPVFDSSKEEMVPIWVDMVKRAGVQIRMNEAVEAVQRGPDGMFEVRTNVGACRAQRVVLATGLRGKPRTLGVPGENLTKVQALLEDPDQHRGQTVCVVGGGDSALEAAIALADAGAKVILTYRGKSFSRAQPKNKQAIESYEAQRRIKVKYQSEVVEIAEDTVTLQMSDGTQKRYPNEAAFVLIGADPPVAWLATLGVHFVERHHMFALPKSDELVRQFVSNAVSCPENAAAAAALLAGHDVVEELKKRPVVAESRSKKWLRSASGMFGGQSGNKLDRPMPLSEFAKQARKHSGQGRRDKLDPRERTRVLRMLRDEGGRQADEDSKIYVLDRSNRFDDSGSRRIEGSPPPAGPTHLPPYYEDEAGRGGYDPIATLPPMGEPRPTNLGRPSRSSRESPKPAVIVGLARAAAQAQAAQAQAAQVRRRKEPSRPAPLPVIEEETRQLGAEDARRMLERMQAEGTQSERMRVAPRPAPKGRPGGAPGRPAVDDGPTDYDEIAVDQAMIEDEATHSVDLRRGRSGSGSRSRPQPPEEQPTRQLSGKQIDALGRDPALDAAPTTAWRGVQRQQPPPAAPPVRAQDEPTRAVDFNRGDSLSEVEWDLD